MPMMWDFVPKALRPWIYVCFAIIFQMVNGVYMGSQGQMVGDWCFLREDIIFIFACGVVGVNMPFPILFRLKFRFTNHQLLLFAVSGMALCQLVPLATHWLPLLCLTSFVCCFFKLMATFECMSNIQLWMTPKRDFQVFFPLLYIIVLGDMSWSNWISSELAYYCGSWEAMHWFVFGLLLLVALTLLLITKNFRFMKPLPFVSIDWLGMVLWSIVLLQGIWIFVYGEHYNWWESRLWTTTACLWPVTIWVCVGRMLHIRHPYLHRDAFAGKRMLMTLLMFGLAEVMNASPKALGNVFISLNWGWSQTSSLQLFSLAGNIAGCIFCLGWLKALRQNYTRLLTVGFAFLLLYQVLMYFRIFPGLDYQSLWFPTFILAVGYAIFFTTCTIYMEELLTFQTFFMGLTISGFMRNGFVENMCSGIYAYFLRYKVADNLASGWSYTSYQSLLMGLKEVYGALCIFGCAVLLLMMLWDVKPVRSTLKKMPYWNVLGRQIRKAEKR